MLSCQIPVGILLLLIGCGKPRQDARAMPASTSTQHSAQEIPRPAAQTPSPASAHSLVTINNLPSEQRTFLGVISSYAEAYKNESHELRRSKMKQARWEAFPKNMSYPTNWKGTIAKLGTNSEGKAYVSIAFPSEGTITYTGADRRQHTAPLAPVVLKTYDKDVSGAGMIGLISQGTRMFDALSDLEVGDPVVFSATYIMQLEPKDVTYENATEEGKMTSPVIYAQFSSIERAR